MHVVNGVQLQVHLFQDQHEFVQYSHLIGLQLSLKVGFFRFGGSKIFIHLDLVLTQGAKGRS